MSLIIAIAVFAGPGAIAQECKTEIQTLCNDVEIGEGRILACLAEQEEKVGDACKKAVADTVGE